MSTSSSRASLGHGFQKAPYGSWKSPITSELITTGSGGLGRIVSDGQDLYWVESRSAEGGRMVIVHRTEDGHISDLTPAPYNVRTRVHEYGGASFAVSNGTLYFSNFVDQRVYRQLSGGEPEPITPPEKLRYADCIIDRRHGRMI